jgi:hypothetical protein
LGEKSQTPSKELVEAWISTMMAVMVSKAALPDAPPDELNKFGMNLIGRITDRIDESRLAEFSLGMEQVLQHLGANPDILKNEVMKDRSMGGFVHQPAQE